MILINALMASILAAVTLTPVTPPTTPHYTMGQPSYGGSGCPADTLTITTIPMTGSVVLTPSAFKMSTAANDTSVMRYSCNLSVPIEVDKGYNIALADATYVGTANLPADTSAQLDAEYFFAGDEGPKFSTKLTGPVTGDFTDTHTLKDKDRAWSECGGSVNLRLNMGILMRAKPDTKASLTLHSIILPSGIISRPCR